MQKEYYYNQNSIVNAHISIYNKMLEINELNNIIESLGNNINNLSTMGNILEVEKFSKIKEIYKQKKSIIQKEIILLGLFISRKEMFGAYNNYQKKYKIK